MIYRISDEKNLQKYIHLFLINLKYFNSIYRYRIAWSSGKHLSEGERSMISAYQESVLKYADDEDRSINTIFSFL